MEGRELAWNFEDDFDWAVGVVDEWPDQGGGIHIRYASDSEFGH